MFMVLRQAGFGSNMLNWICSVYSGPSARVRARVRANGVLSDPFPIANRTRQGCPLSPLLFALSLEPVSCAAKSRCYRYESGTLATKSISVRYDVFAYELNHLPPKPTMRIGDLWHTLQPKNLFFQLRSDGGVYTNDHIFYTSKQILN